MPETSHADEIATQTAREFGQGKTDVRPYRVMLGLYLGDTSLYCFYLAMLVSVVGQRQSPPVATPLRLVSLFQTIVAMLGNWVNMLSPPLKHFIQPFSRLM